MRAGKRNLLTDATASEAEEGYVRRLGLEEQHTASAKIRKARRMYLAVGLLLGSALAAAVVYTTIPHRTILSAGTASTFVRANLFPPLRGIIVPSSSVSQSCGPRLSPLLAPSYYTQGHIQP